MAWGSTYSNGGQNANYQWGVPSLNGQMGGLGSGSANASVSGNFDPTTMLNIMRNDAWRQATWNREQELADRTYYQKLAQQAANRGQGGWTGGVPRESALDRAVRESQAQAAIAQARAQSEGMPLKYITAPYAAGGYYAPNTEFFTGAQRQVFGPNNAGFDQQGVSRIEAGGQGSDAVWGGRLAQQQGRQTQGGGENYDTFREGMRMYRPDAYLEMIKSRSGQRQGGE